MRTNRQSYVLAIAIWLAAFAYPLQVKAATAGQPCSSVGVTSVSEDQRNMLVCLYYGSQEMRWVALAGQVQTPPNSTDDNAPAVAAPRPSEALLSPSTRWQGWYAGADVGYAETSDKYTNTSGSFGGGYMSSPFDHTMDGSSAGLVGGYNHVASDNLFYGGEADINYLGNGGNERVSYFDRQTVSNEQGNFTGQWTGYATMRGRVGMAFDPALIYLTGGVAMAEVKNTWLAPLFAREYFDSRTIEAGWTAGTGAEFALTREISLSAQYLHLQMLGHYVTAMPNGNRYAKFQLIDSADILRVGANWHFD